MVSNFEQHILNINDLNIRFGGIKALQNINLAIPAHKITAIIGPNGAGKTTLFNCITGFYQPNSGMINLNVNNQTINLNALLGEKIHLSDLLNKNIFTKIYYNILGGAYLFNRTGIARTFQNIRLFNKMSVLENLLVAQHVHINKNLLSGLFNLASYKKSEQAALDKAIYWLDICGIKKYANHIAGSLPYGHQRLLEIARAMCTSPKIICLDEPAAGLNRHETKNLGKLIQEINTKHQTTVLLIEHDISLVMSISQLIYVLDHGKIIASGMPAEIRNNPIVKTAYFGDVNDGDNSNSH